MLAPAPVCPLSLFPCASFFPYYQAYKADVSRALRVKADQNVVAKAALGAAAEAREAAAADAAARVAEGRAEAAAALAEGLRANNAKTAEQLEGLIGDLSAFKRDMQGQFVSLEQRFLESWRSSSDELAADSKRQAANRKDWQSAIASLEVGQSVSQSVD